MLAGGLEKVAVADETAAEGGPREALSRFLRTSCIQYSDVVGLDTRLLRK